MFLKYFKIDPIYVGETYCNLYNSSANIGDTSRFYKNNHSLGDLSMNQTNFDSIDIKPETNIIKRLTKCKASHDMHHNETHFEDYHYHNEKFMPEPNIALISFILLIGTCAMALYLKKLRRSNFFGSYVSKHILNVLYLKSVIIFVFLNVIDS